MNALDASDSTAAVACSAVRLEDRIRAAHRLVRQRQQSPRTRRQAGRSRPMLVFGGDGLLRGQLRTDVLDTPKSTDRPVTSALSPGCGWRARQTGAHLLPNAGRELRDGRRCRVQCDACQVRGDAIRCASAATLTFSGRRRRPRMDRADRRRWLKQVDPVPPIPSSQRVARRRPRRWTHGR